MRLRDRLVLALICAACAKTAAACDYCLISQGISPLDTVTGHGLRVSQRYTELDSVYDGTRGLANPGARETFYTTEVSAFWSPRSWLTVIGVLPLRVTAVDGHLEHRGGAHAHGDEHAHGHDHGHGQDHTDDPALREVEDQRGGASGIGDASLLARARVFRHHSLSATTTVALLAGVKIASGTTDSRADNGDYLDAHSQLGTGATDALVGAAASYARGRWSLSGNLLGALKGEGESGRIDYEYGDSINYDLTLRYRLQPAVIGASSRHWFVSCGVAGEARAREREGGSEIEDSGGHTVYVQPGLQLNLAPRWTFEVSAQVPVHHDLTGTQLGEDLKVFGSVTVLL